MKLFKMDKVPAALPLFFPTKVGIHFHPSRGKAILTVVGRVKEMVMR
jgi:hypothetical protein